MGALCIIVFPFEDAQLDKCQLPSVLGIRRITFLDLSVPIKEEDGLDDIWFLPPLIITVHQFAMRTTIDYREKTSVLPLTMGLRKHFIKYLFLFYSLCNQTGSLEQEDLELCEALVLHQLQRLLQNTPNGCLLSEKMLNDKSRMQNEKQVGYNHCSDSYS